jgi:putrescine transport system ATP-binding protein
MTEALRPVFAPWNDPDEKPLIQFKNVTKRFGDFTAIDDLTIDIFEREFFALLGPSGCGKTTLMRMLAGFETPTEGTILLSGQDIAPIPPNKRAVNMMFQSYALFPHLSVWENIAFGLKREGMKGDALNSRVDEMLRLTRLERFAKRKPHQISGGQRQRVALARSLAKAPKLLLLDEPLGALDKKLRQDTQFELMDIQEKTGTTFVIVTHDQEEAMTVASRIAVMDEGRMIQVDSPARIYEAPNTVYVADFIGDVNIIEGRATPSGEHVQIAWGEGVSDITGTTDTSFEKGDKVHFAFDLKRYPSMSKNLTTHQMHSKERFWTSPIWATYRPITLKCPTDRSSRRKAQIHAVFRAARLHGTTRFGLALLPPLAFC